MKKLLVTSVIAIISVTVFAQKDYYYWSAGKMNYLEEEIGSYLVKFTSEKKTEDIVKDLINYQNIVYASAIKDDLGIIIQKEGSVAYTPATLKSWPEIENAMPTYKMGNLPFFLTGEVLLQPKPDVPIEKILELVNLNLKVKRKTKYNTYILETIDWDKIIEYSNRIYESGLVNYCHPNFIALMKKTIDPLYSDQYYLNNTGQFGGTAGIDINAPEAWNLTLGSSTIKVAVIDDGVETHEELTGRILQGYTPQSSANNPDTHGAPNLNDPRHTDSPYDADGPVGHGECCTGIIAASHNSIGIRGIAPNVQIVP
jgi:serine protease